MNSTQPVYNHNELECLEIRLKATLEYASLDEKVQALLEMLNECMPVCSTELLDEKTFTIILSHAHQLNLQIINEINKSLEDAEIDVDDIIIKLTICKTLLDCWQLSMDFINRYDNIHISKINVFVSSLLEVIKDNLDHCRIRENKYASCQEQVAEELKNLFELSITILKKFCTILNEKIILEAKDDINIFIEAIDKIGEMASLTKELDLNTSIDLWKYFGKFALKHENQFKKMESNKIVPHLQQICKDIIKLLPRTLQQRQSSKISEKNIIYVGLLLKILIKLGNTYGLFIKSIEFIPFLLLLIELKRYSPSCLNILDMDISIIQQIELNVISEVDALLEVCLKNDDFPQAFFQLQNNNLKDALGYHLLTLNILKLIAKQDYDQQKPWFSNEYSILDEIFLNVDKVVHTIMCMDKLRLPYQVNNKQIFSLYESSVIATCSFICQVPACDFRSIELLMLKHLLSGQLWASLLSSDLWSFVGRICSPQLCFHHVQYLINLYDQLWRRRDNMEVIIIFNLIGRLYSKLSDKDKNIIINNIGSMDSRVRHFLLRAFCQKMEMVLKKNKFSNQTNIIEAYQMICDLPSVNNWNNFINQLWYLGFLCEEWNNENVNIILELWNKTTKIISNYCCEIVRNLSFDLINIMLHVIQIKNNGTSFICTILKYILECYIYMSPQLRIKTCQYLKYHTLCLVSNDANYIKSLAILYCILLEDNMSPIKQEAFESFDCFIQSNPNEDLINKVTKVIVNRAAICEYVKAYLTCEFYFKNDFSSVAAYFKQLTNEKVVSQRHKCYLKDVKGHNEKEPKIETCEHELSTVIEKRIDAVCKEIQEIAKFRNKLKEEVVNKLKLAVFEIFDTE